MLHLYKSTKLLFVILFLVLQRPAFSQTYEYIYRNSKDSSVNCYLKVIPQSGKINGIIVRDYSSLPDITKKGRYQLRELANQNGLMTLYTVTSKFFPELYYNDSCTALLDQIINEVIIKHGIPKQNIFIGGISASGTRALRYAQFCEQGKSKFGIKIKAVFAVDPPLDIERFYLSAKNHLANFKLGMLSEAHMVIKKFPEKLGGTPDKVPMNYRNASVFSDSDSLGGNAMHYKNIPILIFHEPDIDWWIAERGASYYDINSYDIAGFVNRVKLIGGNKIEMVITSGKGFDDQGNRKCHSWTIVDEDYLINWILRKVEN